MGCKQSAFRYPYAEGEIELGQSCFRAGSSGIHLRDFNAWLSSGYFARVEISHRYLKPIECAFCSLHEAG